MTGLRPGPGARVAIIGDVGGHADALRAKLARLGVPDDGTGPIPPELHIVQVGDLVHRGPDSAAAVALADRHLQRSPGNWIQLLGNHEAFYLQRLRQFTWSERVPRHTAATLKRWWSDGQLRVAVAVHAGAESFVITHAGVTRGFWTEVLGAETDADKVAEGLDELRRSNRRALFTPGTMLGFRTPTPNAGPIWAAAGPELMAGWLEHPMPFSQAHGHTSVYDWDNRRWHADRGVRDRISVDSEAKHITVTLPGGRLVGVDPGQDALAAGRWRSFELSGDDRDDQ